MKIKVQNTPKKTHLLCGFVLEKSDKVLGLPKLDAKTSFAVNQSLKDIEGKAGKLSIIPSTGKKQFQRILIAGIGRKEDITKDTFRQISGELLKKHVS